MEKSDDDKHVKGFCSECKSEMRDSWMYKNVFAQEGNAPSCPFCGGVVIVADKRQKDQVFKQVDRERGLG